MVDQLQPQSPSEVEQESQPVQGVEERGEGRSEHKVGQSVVQLLSLGRVEAELLADSFLRAVLRHDGDGENVNSSRELAWVPVRQLVQWAWPRVVKLLLVQIPPDTVL